MKRFLLILALVFGFYILTPIPVHADDDQAVATQETAQTDSRVQNPDLFLFAVVVFIAFIGISSLVIHERNQHG